MTTTREAGRRGAEVRNRNLTPEERSEASRKAAQTRKSEDPNAFSKMGQKGGSHSRGDKSEESE